MNAHHFVDGIKVQRFSLTLLGEARLQFQSFELLNNGLGQNYKVYIDKDIQNWVICENNYFKHGDHLILTKIQKP